MKKKKKNYDWIGFVIVFIIITILLHLYVINDPNSYPSDSPNCLESKEVCYKTECNFWGCKHFKVDIDSLQCESKRMECIKIR